MNDVLNGFRQFSDNIGENLLFLSQEVANSIKSRTRKGIGPDKRKLPPYSAKYARFKKMRGRNSNIRDLTYTGRMLQAITVKRPDKHTSVISFLGQAEKVKAISNDNRTPFFEIGEMEDEIIDKYINKALEKL